MRERRLRGSFSIPAVAYDGSASGLTPDGRTLVLIAPRRRYPRKQTTFAVVDARRLAVRRVIRLKGDFSFDAISPDGRVMYLIQYDSRNFSNYAVRAYDLRAGRLYRQPVVDPREPDEAMTGVPVTRVAERRRPLGIHALRQPRAPVRARARHRAPHGGVHRPRRPEPGLGRHARAARSHARGGRPLRARARDHRYAHAPHREVAGAAHRGRGHVVAAAGRARQPLLLLLAAVVRRRRMASYTAAVLAAIAAAPPTASAGGLLPVGVDGTPVASPVSDTEFVTYPRKRGTVLQERVSGSGSVLRTIAFRKRFHVPTIAYDNSVGGVSADGRRLVLITLRGRSPRELTELAIVDARRMRLRRIVRLRGDFSFHALSPDGEQMYVLHYAPWDISTYAIRVYNLRTGRLRPGSVSEPEGSGEAMRGVPMTQALGPGGRWQYTLYGVLGRPYLHSLDTVRRRAFRTPLDRPSRRSNKLWRVRLQPSANQVAVTLGGEVLTRVDTATHQLIRRPAAGRARRTPASPGPTSQLPRWPCC